MKALILLSHGSRRLESNDEMVSLAGQIDAQPDNPYDRVACAFQQFADPSFDKTVDQLVSEGITAFDVLPLFLAAGSHVLVDVPRMIAGAKHRYPQIRITVAPHLGQTPTFARFLLDQAIRLQHGGNGP